MKPVEEIAELWIQGDSDKSKEAYLSLKERVQDKADSQEVRQVLTDLTDKLLEYYEAGRLSDEKVRDEIFAFLSASVMSVIKTCPFLNL